MSLRASNRPLSGSMAFLGHLQGLRLPRAERPRAGEQTQELLLIKLALIDRGDVASRGEGEGGINLYVQIFHRQVHRRTRQWRRRQEELWVCSSPLARAGLRTRGPHRREKSASTGAGRASARTAARAAASTGAGRASARTAAQATASRARAPAGPQQGLRYGQPRALAPEGPVQGLLNRCGR